MATQTPNFNFDLRESADIFNPLSTNANFESLDTILKNLQETGGIITYTTTAAANLLKLSGTPKVNDTVFKFVAAGDANTWTAATGGVVNNIVALDGKQKTVKAGELYVAFVNAANAMVVIAWPDVVNAQTFDGKGPAEWATKVQLDAVNQTAANATQTAQAAATVANNALAAAQAAGMKKTLVWSNRNPTDDYTPPQRIDWERDSDAKFIVIETESSTTFLSPEQTAFHIEEYNISPGSSTQNMFFRVRYGSLDANGISFATQFGRCYEGMIGSGGSTRVELTNGYCVPLRVYELK